jgi:hypothetical protein
MSGACRQIAVQKSDLLGCSCTPQKAVVRPTTLAFSGLVPSVSEDQVRCNGGLGSSHGKRSPKRAQAAPASLSGSASLVSRFTLSERVW